MFKLDEILPYFQRVNRRHYLGELLWRASSKDLRKFKKTVKKHRKKSPFVQDLHYMPRLSQQDVIIKAINFALFKRSVFYPAYKLILPLRKKVVSIFSGVDIQEHPYCGVLYVKRQNRKTFLRLTMNEIILVTKMFWLKHWQFLIKTSVAIAVLVLAAITLYFRIIGKI